LYNSHIKSRKECSDNERNSLVLGVGAWVVATIAIAKSARSHISKVLSFSLCAVSLVTELFEISRRVNLGDYAAIEDTIRAATY